jgi:hypothetical protein
VVDDVPLPLDSCWGRVLTATKPLGDVCDVCGCGILGRPTVPPFISATFDGLAGRRVGGLGLAVARRSRIACLRPFSL